MKAIVAVDRNWGIGRDGDQLVYLSEDLRRFKALTLDSPPFRADGPSPDGAT